MAGVLEERAAIEREIAGRTVCGQLKEAAESNPDAPAYSDPVEGGWSTLTYSQARQRVLEIAAGFAALGLEPGEAVALMMVNRSEHVLADLGAVHAGGVSCSVYSTFAPDQVAFVAGDVAARIAVLGGPADLARWEPVLDELPGLRKVIVLEGAPAGDRFVSWDDFLTLGRETLAADPAAVDARWQAVTADDVLTVLYTSGTTGNPKGVPLTHSNVFFEVVATNRMAELPSNGTQISYLTYAHIAERVLSLYLPLFKFSHTHFCTDLAQLGATLGQVKPVLFFGVPRVWEKMMAAIQAVLGAEQDPARRSAVTSAMAAGQAYVEACSYGRSATPEVLEAYSRAEETVLGPMRSLIGLDRVRHTLSAAAPLPIEVARFFAGLGLRILDVYGMTETTGAATANLPDAFKLGTVGRAMPGIELRLADDGEILLRGTTCTPGYLGLPSATAELLDSDGWVHTGDLGTLDADGFLSVVDRKKEIIITAGGENIAPSLIENLLKEHPLVGQALAYGNGRRHVVAVLTLDGEVAPVWAAARGLPGDLGTLASDPVVLEEIAAAVDAANVRLARVQQVKKWTLLPDEWTAESEELTPTLKLKRRVIHTKYASAIDALYA
jgi:long-chain acyl-CoA synthetase